MKKKATDIPDTPARPPADESQAISKREELAAILKRFSGCFLQEVNPPDQADLDIFSKLIPALYLKAGNKKATPDYFWNMVKAVDKRWMALKLCKTVEGMVTRFTRNVPPPPGLRLLRHLEATGKQVDPEKGHPLFSLLARPDVEIGAARWTSLSADLDILVS